MEVLSIWLVLAAALFCLGLYGLLTRRNAIALLLSVELMLNAVNLNLVAFSHGRGDHTGQLIAIFAMALTVAEVAIGLALLMQLSRTRRSLELNRATELSG
jgi:NADH:ubiquinone oxidoreductase subunit K